MNRDSLHHLRRTYKHGTLEVENLLADPRIMMKEWLQRVIELDIYEANAMALSTSGEDGQPSSRIVLLKEISEEGFVFYTNYHSRKGRELEKNARASLLFFWKEVEQQVRIEGVVHKISEAASKSYFQSRPKGSQLGAWTSPQSKIIPDRSSLKDRHEELRDIYQNLEQLPLPAHWGGYCLKPHYYEFWQGRDNRLHDRFEYRLEKDGSWVINRLAP